VDFKRTVCDNPDYEKMLVACLTFGACLYSSLYKGIRYNVASTRSDTPNATAVFSTAFELRGADVPFFSCAGKKVFEQNWGEYIFFVKNVVLLKFDGL
jgi:hypothetical protein